VDFVALGASLGMKTQRIADSDAIGPALKESIASGVPTLLDVVVEGKV
jgi:thiamine pyrophosphate-dependent acetolactate synthase large subunit-like protein